MGVLFLLIITLGSVFALIVMRSNEIAIEYRLSEEERKKREEQQQVEEQNRIEKQNYISSWSQYNKEQFNYILHNVVGTTIINNFVEMYKQFEKAIKEEKTQYPEILLSYTTEKKEHISNLRETVRNALTNGTTDKSQSFVYAINAINCLNIISPDDAAYAEEALQILLSQISDINAITQELSFENYGEVSQNFLSDSYLSSISQYSDEFMNKAEMDIKNKIDGTCFSVAKYFPKNYVNILCKLMWYHAATAPFEIEKLNRTSAAYNRYTSSLSIYQIGKDQQRMVEFDKVEVLLSRVLFKKNIGGETIAKQEWEVLDQWIDDFSNSSSERKVQLNDELYILASGLAWMELYDMELAILRKCVKSNIRLNEELQSRLQFLENGGKADIKVYYDLPEGFFLFDNSSLEWKEKGFELYFRKVGNRQKIPNYSLVIERWSKSIPLSKGQSFAQEQLSTPFLDMVDDYDGEILYSNVTAKDISLKSNIKEGASLFSFTSERCRCVSMLFYCEKFGRNLNIEILTLFTPDKMCAIDQLQRYCSAIRNNFYVESFRNTILQTVEKQFTVKENIY